MQTFLPFENFLKSAMHLDYRRLGKQRVEAKQILNCLYYRKNNDFYMIDKNGRRRRRGWIDHVAVKMWEGYEEALKAYINTMIYEWVLRGYNNTMESLQIDQSIRFEYPHWLGNEDFHASHRSNLLRKNCEYYSKFGWEESDDLPYIWPKGKFEYYTKDIEVIF